jgi:hypothetical protein
MQPIRPVPQLPKQEELIRRYCEEAEALLSSAEDYPSAVRMKQSICKRFQEECDSELIVHATGQFIDNLIKTRWGMPDGSGATIDHN